MAPLAAVVDKLDAVPEKAREFYEQRDGKFHLTLDGSPTGFVPAAELATANGKVVEFREKNITLMKENDELKPKVKAFEGIDPVVARTAVTELAELKAKGVNKPDDVATIVKSAVEAAVDPLRKEIKAAKDETAAERIRADQSTLRSIVGEEFSKVGGIPSALDYIVGKAGDAFKVEGGKVVAMPNKFSSEHPGDPLSVKEWLGTTMIKEADFAFKASTGSGAGEGRPGGGGPTGLKPGQTELRNPTASQLGEHSKAIKDGKMVVRYDEVKA